MNRNRWVVAFCVVMLGIAVRVQAGSLTPPPGPIQPTDRVTLNQQAITLPYTITQPGSYVLTSDLYGSMFQDGIIIDASLVTLDLNGFTLVGIGNSGSGVRINGALEGVVIRNGIIGGWDGSGVDASSAIACRIADLEVFAVGGDGVRLGSSSVVSGLNMRAVIGSGLRVVGNDNRIDNNHFTSCGTGITVGGIKNLIVRNSASFNTADYAIGSGNSYGPIVLVGGVGDISTIPGANHPWANFSMSCTIGVEVCDGVDNNCNNQIDESDPVVGLSCNTGLLGPCAAGVIVCNTGALVCDPTYSPQAETCNGEDDNCDGSADEGNPGCGANQFCVSGSCACSAGFANCNGNPVDGCEVNTTSDPNNCGLCGFSCPSGICTASACVQFSNGTPCTFGSQCSSSFCVDGVCCNSPCNALCVACTAALKGSGSNGTCGNIAAGTDPQSECTGGTPNCNGAGGCGP